MATTEGLLLHPTGGSALTPTRSLAWHIYLHVVQVRAPTRISGCVRVLRLRIYASGTKPLDVLGATSREFKDEGSDRRIPLRRQHFVNFHVNVVDVPRVIRYPIDFSSSRTEDRGRVDEWTCEDST